MEEKDDGKITISLHVEDAIIMRDIIDDAVKQLKLKTTLAESFVISLDEKIK